MPLAQFLGELFNDGHVHVDRVAPIAADDAEQAWLALVEREQLVRQNFFGRAPDMDRAAAIWGATVMYRCCQAAVFRDLSAEDLDALLAERCPAKNVAAAHYSVDLSLVFLPDLARFTVAAAADDPLCADLRRIAADWPLSSVGMKLETAPDIEPLLSSENLFRYYVDRVIARVDESRRSDPRVEAAVAAVFGAHTAVFAAPAGTTD